MSLVVVRVELPTYSHSFNVRIPATSTVFDVKQAIFLTCVGQPRPEGQRIIWRGRYLGDEEKLSELWPSSSGLRVVHLSVRPSAWTGVPPNASTVAPSSSPTTAPSGTNTLWPELTRAALPALLGFPSNLSPPISILGDNLAFIRYRHRQALCFLSNFKLSPPDIPVNLVAQQTAAKLALQQRGYLWPDILDATFPSAAWSSQGGLHYEVVTIGDKSYLTLPTPGVPNSMQGHALKVLTYTFSILSLPPTLHIPTPTIPQSLAVPAQVNDLLQQLGLPLLRPVPNANVDVTTQPGIPFVPPAAPEHAEANLLREIPVRALLAPFLMIVFRTVLLLYFFSPTRKPFLGLCIVAWIMYEMWTHIRIVVLRPLNRAAGDIAERANAGQAPVGAAPRAAQANGQAGQTLPGPTPGNREQTHDDQQAQGPPPPSQSHGIVDSFALTNIHDENKMIWPTLPARPPYSPSFVHRATTFLILIIVTLHPEVFSRRRTALRQREGRLRTEMNALGREPQTREDGVPGGEERRSRELRQQLQTQHGRRALSIREYVDRVREADWIDE
ncbi:hypothetical protein F5I97DRAFT_910061 [Phlebopus sp. FC_14]|nr:hypothetical protein F5I97DRAFT_910061 [Phlebopus sp. FC_14]